MNNTINTTTSEWQPAPAETSRPLCAIGDIHGCANLLRALRGCLDIELKVGTTLVYLGDLIDPHSKREHAHDCADVVDQVAIDVAAGANVLAGNHDAFLLIALDAARRNANLPWEAGLWRDQGGAETAESWGVVGARGMRDIEIAREIRARMTPAQIGVIEAMRVYVEHDSYLLVHAGFEPHVPLARQFAEANVLEYPTMRGEKHHPLWMRFKNSTDTAPQGRVLIHGHNSTRRPILGRKRICIDTGTKYGGPLTAIEIVGNRMRLHQAWPAGMTPERWHKDGMR